MKEKLLEIPDKLLRKDGKFTHHAENNEITNNTTLLNKKITKAKKIKFVSIDKAKGDLID
jgi:hypothetical protein